MDKKLPKIRFNANSTNYVFTLNNISIRWQIERYQEDVQVLSGKIKQQIAGHRLYVSVNYNASLEATEWDNFAEALYIHFVTNNSESMTVELSDKDGSFVGATSQDMVVESDRLLSMEFSNQIGNFTPSIDLKGLDRVGTIPNDWRPEWL